MIKMLQSLDRFVNRFAFVALSISIIFMLVLTVGSIILRWFSITFVWVDPFVRHLVFLSAFLGGVIAVGKRKHIAIDIIPRLLEARGNRALKINLARVVDLTCLLVSTWLLITSINLVKVEFVYGQVGFLNIHSAFLIMIIPFGFSLIAYRFFVLFLSSFTEDHGVKND